MTVQWLLELNYDLKNRIFFVCVPEEVCVKTQIPPLPLQTLPIMVKFIKAGKVRNRNQLLYNNLWMDELWMDKIFFPANFFFTIRPLQHNWKKKDFKIQMLIALFYFPLYRLSSFCKAVTPVKRLLSSVVSTHLSQIIRQTLNCFIRPRWRYQR